MLMTEEQARTKWCPKALHQSGGDEPAANRWADRDGHHPNPPECRCLASDCMAWRFGPVAPSRRQHFQVVDIALVQWMLDNPTESEPSITDSDEVWDAYDKRMGEWSARGVAFLSELDHGPAPDGEHWEWCVGFDSEEDKLYAFWFHKEQPQGFCGLAGRVGG